VEVTLEIRLVSYSALEHYSAGVLVGKVRLGKDWLRMKLFPNQFSLEQVLLPTIRPMDPCTDVLLSPLVVLCAGDLETMVA
jgi:hypothetical protein